MKREKDSPFGAITPKLKGAAVQLPKFCLSSLSALQSDVINFRPTHVVTIIDPDMPLPSIPEGIERCVLRFHDVTTGSGNGPRWIEPPMGGHIRDLIELGNSLTPETRILVHCHAGISRSPAAILIIAAAASGSADVAKEALMQVDPNRQTDPNRRMLMLAERPLEMRGRLTEIAAENSKSRVVSAENFW